MAWTYVLSKKISHFRTNEPKVTYELFRERTTCSFFNLRKKIEVSLTIDARSIEELASMAHNGGHWDYYATDMITTLPAPLIKAEKNLNAYEPASLAELLDFQKNMSLLHYEQLGKEMRAGAFPLTKIAGDVLKEAKLRSQ